ncbi:MAG: hypothetical protein QW727_00240 [Candidatus Pacearchaeota archaeon]
MAINKGDKVELEYEGRLEGVICIKKGIINGFKIDKREPYGRHNNGLKERELILNSL